jgi:hypothetical protein
MSPASFFPIHLSLFWAETRQHSVTGPAWPDLPFPVRPGTLCGPIHATWSSLSPFSQRTTIGPGPAAAQDVRHPPCEPGARD